MTRKAYLASIVPVIVNAILNEHQIVVDIVAFVNKGDFPRSRLGEKQRGKILASWVTRKMRTVAQFSIRDADSTLSDVAETIEPRSGPTSLKNGSVLASSLRNVEPAPQIVEEEAAAHAQAPQGDSAAMPPPGILEMPAENYNDSPTNGNGLSGTNDATPTDPHGIRLELPGDQNFGAFEIPSFNLSAPEQPPRVGPKPPVASPPAPPDAELGGSGIQNLPSQQHSNLVIRNTSTGQEDESWRQDAAKYMGVAE